MFFFNFDSYFPNIWAVQIMSKIYTESIGIYYKNIESIEVTTLQSNAFPFHFAWRILWNLMIQFRSMIEWKAFYLNESSEKGKTANVAKSKLVLGAEFLLTTFTFDLVLTTHVFCVALHQSFGIELFHFEIHSLYICGTPHKI